MKYLIAADLHGSAYYCEKLIEAFENEKADKLLLLGDLLYHGPRNPLPKGYDPKKVFEALNKLKDKIICVRGNCDSEVDQMVLEFPIMAGYTIIDVDGFSMFATHGHMYNKDNPPPLRKRDVLLNGHFHVPEVAKLDCCTYINPGSLSMPKEDSYHSYLTYEAGRFSWKNLLDETKYKCYDVMHI